MMGLGQESCVVILHGQTLFSHMGIIAFGISAPLKKEWESLQYSLILRPTDSVGCQLIARDTKCVYFVDSKLDGKQMWIMYCFD